MYIRIDMVHIIMYQYLYFIILFAVGFHASCSHFHFLFVLSLSQYCVVCECGKVFLRRNGNSTFHIHSYVEMPKIYWVSKYDSICWIRFLEYIFVKLNTYISCVIMNFYIDFMNSQILFSNISEKCVYSFKSTFLQPSLIDGILSCHFGYNLIYKDTLINIHVRISRMVVQYKEEATIIVIIKHHAKFVLFFDG